MTHELAQKLKDAGFSQHEEGETSHPNDCLNDLCLPTLSELIYSIGEHFWRIELNPLVKNQWLAIGIFSKEDNWSKTGHGDTPEEAVANLWLMLNKKTL